MRESLVLVVIAVIGCVYIPKERVDLLNPHSRQ